MKMLAEYFDTAIKFEQMAAQETIPSSRRTLSNKPPLITSSRKKEPRNTDSRCRINMAHPTRPKLKTPFDFAPRLPLRSYAIAGGAGLSAWLADLADWNLAHSLEAQSAPIAAAMMHKT
jgi:hypothetical protein